MKTLFLIVCCALLMLAVGSVLAQEETPEPTVFNNGPTLTAVLGRGQVVCGVNQELFGFGFLNPNTGTISGIYVDFCRAITTAVLGDPAAVDLRLQTFGSDASALINGELDVMLVHHITQTLTQDAQNGLAFGAPVFYDGQSIMVRADSGLETWESLEGETICVHQDSLSEANFVAEMRRRGLAFELLRLASPSEMNTAFLDGRCSAQTYDRSLLEIRRFSTDNPFSYIVWNQPFTRVVIAPVYRYGDQQWANIVNWTLWGLIQAETLGITSKNVSEFIRLSDEPDESYLGRVGLPVAQLLDAKLGLGSQLGLPNDFMYTVIEQVGNYGEIYERALGSTSALPIERQLNQLVTAGGLIAAPDWR